VSRWEPEISQNYSSDGNLISIKIKRTMGGEWEQIHPSVEREWVGLTDEEVGGLTVFDGLHDVEVPILADFVRAIEAKLKEKNT